jgi:hypothetical protein
MNRLQLAILTDAIYDALCEVEQGTDLYEAVSDLVDKNQFYAIMTRLITSGKVRKVNNHYEATR